MVLPNNARGRTIAKRELNLLLLSGFYSPYLCPTYVSKYGRKFRTKMRKTRPEGRVCAQCFQGVDLRYFSSVGLVWITLRATISPF